MLIAGNRGLIVSAAAQLNSRANDIAAAVSLSAG